MAKFKNVKHWWLAFIEYAISEKKKYKKNEKKLRKEKLYYNKILNRKELTRKTNGKLQCHCKFLQFLYICVHQGLEM